MNWNKSWKFSINNIDIDKGVGKDIDRDTNMDTNKDMEVNMDADMDIDMDTDIDTGVPNSVSKSIWPSKIYRWSHVRETKEADVQRISAQSSSVWSHVG